LILVESRKPLSEVFYFIDSTSFSSLKLKELESLDTVGSNNTVEDYLYPNIRLQKAYEAAPESS
jgi:hypothetical protein